MPVEYFSWTAPEFAYLRSYMTDMFEYEYDRFCDRLADTGSEVLILDSRQRRPYTRAQNILVKNATDTVRVLPVIERYCNSTERRLRELCWHFELDADTTLGQLNHSIGDPGNGSFLGSVRFENCVDDIIKALVKSTGERVAQFYRPKAFATANEHVMAWLRQRPSDIAGSTTDPSRQS